MRTPPQAEGGQTSLLDFGVMCFTVERRLLVRILETTARRAPRPGRPQILVCLSACGSRIFAEANGKVASTEALVLSEGTCLLVHKTILHLLRGYARRCQNVTFTANMASFYINRGNWPIAGFSSHVVSPRRFQDFPMVERRDRRRDR